MTRLILFDIDGTLISTAGLGMRSMEDAGRQLYNAGFSAAGVDYSGRLDPMIIDDLFANNGVEASEGNRREFRARFRACLEARLRDSTGHRALPGVLALLEALREMEGVALGLLTGNFAETGKMKLSACGVRPEWFCVAAWGDDSPPQHPPSRNQLPPVAMNRLREKHGVELAGARVTVVGDTPHDVACARAHGCGSIGVATGRFGVAALEQAGADHALETLEDTAGVMRRLGLKGK